MEKRYLDELKISEEFLNVAKRNLELSFRTSANRLYFAFERAVVAYLMFKQVKVSKNHQKIWELCDEFLGENFYSHLRNLYDLRMQADYGNISRFIKLDKKVLKTEISKTETLIKKIKKVINEQINKKRL